MRYYVGAYVASPSLHQWLPKEDTEFMSGLRELEGVRGLEQPFYGELHRWDTGWFLANIDPKWDFLLSCIPGTMENLKTDPGFGLASADAEGRRAALRFIGKAREAAARLNDYLKRQAVKGIAVHSAPRNGSVAAFGESLAELAGWDWQGARLLIEHCDAWRPDGKHDKGFLTLEDELAVSRGKADILINWGRSAIEARGAHGPVEHVEKAQGRLGGLMFSGVCAQPHPLHGQWKDSHPPFSDYEPLSIMTPEAARRSLKAADGVEFLGFKIRDLPYELPTAKRLAPLAAAIKTLDLLRGLRDSC